ncbi:NAD-dependent protein deacetylase [Acidothermaceae bacterium B102]|nr:NAD-dependent protein deacetylase [Acidothermaceae bacterium B102]
MSHVRDADLTRISLVRVSYDALADLIGRGDVAVLTGAGISTGSGIPDYRGPTGRARPATPMTYQVFTGSPEARQRYWARSHLGWRFITGVNPNAGHRAVAALQAEGLLTGLVTQNVDGLHQAAGADDVVELHGALDRVICLRCKDVSGRLDLDRRLVEANPGWVRTATDITSIKPDGDADLDDVAGFEVVDCEVCGGLLKPDVVFFGETVPRDRVDHTYALVSGATSLLVLGSSLKVMSGYRFVLHARKLGIPVAILNQGATRGDPQADVRVDGELSDVLTQLADDLAAPVREGQSGA